MNVPRRTKLMLTGSVRRPRAIMYMCHSQKRNGSSGSSTACRKPHRRKRPHRQRGTKHRCRTCSAQKVEVLEKQLKDAKKAVRQAKTDLKKAQEHPEIPESMLEELRAQAETEAAEKAESDLQKKLSEAAAALDKEAAKRKAAEDQLEEARKRQKMADPNIMAVQTLGSQLMTIANAINGHRMKAIMQDQTNAKPINKYLTYVINELRQSFGIRMEELGGTE